MEHGGVDSDHASAGDHYVTISDTGRNHFSPLKASEGVTEHFFDPPH